MSIVLNATPLIQVIEHFSSGNSMSAPFRLLKTNGNKSARNEKDGSFVPPFSPRVIGDCSKITPFTSPYDLASNVSGSKDSFLPKVPVKLTSTVSRPSAKTQLVNLNASSQCMDFLIDDFDDDDFEIGRSLPNDFVGATSCVRRGGGVGSMIIGPVIPLS